MKIFYAVQATGNGHISRAMELLPFLQNIGEVDFFLSGANSSLQLDAPIKYRSTGVSLKYTCKGALDYYKTVRSINPLAIRKEIRELPVEDYDLILNDFEYITASACERKGIRSIQFGHQASFQSEKTPRPAERSKGGEWILKNYAPADEYLGLHFECYDDFILPPVIKKQILDADPRDGGYYTVYLPSYCEPQLKAVFSSLPEFRFEIFSFETKMRRREANIDFIPVSKQAFNESLINCTGIVTGGGFETPAEALHLGKRLMVMPIRGQYEQQCNTAALEKMGIWKTVKLDEQFPTRFLDWIANAPVLKKDYSQTIPTAIERLLQFAPTFA